MLMNTHAINWFEIPVTDFDRAKNFTKPFLITRCLRTKWGLYEWVFFCTISKVVEEAAPLFTILNFMHHQRMAHWFI